MSGLPERSEVKYLTFQKALFKLGLFEDDARVEKGELTLSQLFARAEELRLQEIAEDPRWNFLKLLYELGTISTLPDKEKTTIADILRKHGTLILPSECLQFWETYWLGVYQASLELSQRSAQMMITSGVMFSAFTTYWSAWTQNLVAGSMLGFWNSPKSK